MACQNAYGSSVKEMFVGRMHGEPKEDVNILASHPLYNVIYCLLLCTCTLFMLHVKSIILLFSTLIVHNHEDLNN